MLVGRCPPSRAPPTHSPTPGPPPRHRFTADDVQDLADYMSPDAIDEAPAAQQGVAGSPPSSSLLSQAAGSDPVSRHRQVSSAE